MRRSDLTAFHHDAIASFEIAFGFLLSRRRTGHGL
jgi:hypothetical protein